MKKVTIDISKLIGSLLLLVNAALHPSLLAFGFLCLFGLSAKFTFRQDRF